MTRKRYIILSVIVLLVVARILLPIFLEKYVNKVLDDIPGYTGMVTDVDVALYRGAYVIENLTLCKEDAAVSLPLLNFPENDISLEWSALFKGRIVSEITLHQPEINIVRGAGAGAENKQQDPKADDWREALKDLVPIDINRFEVHGGTINFIELAEDQDIDLSFSELYLIATNLRNVESKNTPLPSSIHATGVSFGGGKVTLDGKIDLMKRIPDLDLDFALKDADVTALNETLLKIAKIDFASGTFELYAEAAIADGYLTGYLKPMFIKTELIGEEDKGFFEKLWEGLVGVFNWLMKNHGTDTLATRAPFEGDLNNLHGDEFTTVINIFKNAWFDAFTTEVEEDIEYQDAAQPKEEDEEEED